MSNAISKPSSATTYDRGSPHPLTEDGGLHINGSVSSLNEQRLNYLDSCVRYLYGRLDRMETRAITDMERDLIFRKALLDAHNGALLDDAGLAAFKEHGGSSDDLMATSASLIDSSKFHKADTPEASSDGHEADVSQAGSTVSASTETSERLEIYETQTISSLLALAATSEGNEVETSEVVKSGTSASPVTSMGAIHVSPDALTASQSIVDHAGEDMELDALPVLPATAGEAVAPARSTVSSSALSSPPASPALSHSVDSTSRSPSVSPVSIAGSPPHFDLSPLLHQLRAMASAAAPQPAQALPSPMALDAVESSAGDIGGAADAASVPSPVALLSNDSFTDNARPLRLRYPSDYAVQTINPSLVNSGSLSHALVSSTPVQTGDIDVKAEDVKAEDVKMEDAVAEPGDGPTIGGKRTVESSPSTESLPALESPGPVAPVQSVVADTASSGNQAVANTVANVAPAGHPPPPPPAARAHVTRRRGRSPTTREAERDTRRVAYYIAFDRFALHGLHRNRVNWVNFTRQHSYRNARQWASFYQTYLDYIHDRTNEYRRYGGLRVSYH